jgi:CHASE2 domain-containing sensor protein
MEPMRFFFKFLFSIHPTFLTLGTILVVVIFFLSGIPILDLVELKTCDLRFLSRGHLPPSPAVVMALVDEKSLDTEGRWPWPRSKFAALVDALSHDGARVIGFDIGFLEPDENFQNDLALANAIKHSSAAVALGYYFHMNEATLDYRIEQQEIDQQLKRISASKYPLILYRERATGFGPFFRAYAPKSNLAMFTEAAASSGYFNLGIDQDDVIRWMPLMIQGSEDLFPSLAVLCAWHYLGKPQLMVKVGRYGVERVQMGDRFIPTDEMGQLLINYLGPAKTFPHFSISDILSGKLAGGTFTDKVVLVGTTAMGTQDLQPTPLSPLYPGVEIHATVIDNILTQRFLTTPQWSKIYDLFAIIILGTLIGIALPRMSALKGLLCAMGLSIVYIVIARWLFVNAGVWLNIVYPLLVVSTNYLGHSFNSVAQQLQQAFRNLQAGEQKHRSRFVEVVRLRTLVFRVEQVFLIHHQTGVLLLHVAADPTTTRDPDLIAGMLIAIQDFVQDSFRVSTDEGPETIQIGELTVWIEKGQLAVLAAVIHGNPPQIVRTLLQDTLATIHLEHANALVTFTGDVRPFETSRPHLEACLLTQTAPHTRKTSPMLWLILVLRVLRSGRGIMSKMGTITNRYRNRHRGC